MRGVLGIVLSAVLVSSVFGCVDDDNNEAFDESEQYSTTAFANDKAAYVFFVGKGLTPAQAAGIVGNLDQESGVSPTIAQAGGPGRGIAQWSVGGRWDTSANDNVRAYAASRGESMTSLSLQLAFIWYELTHFSYGLSQLEAATNTTDAVLAFMDKYEICGTCASSQRISYAKSVLAAYGGTPAYGAKVVTAPPATVTLHCGESAPVKVVLKNAGLVTWTSATKLGTTMPRDRESAFAGDDWPSTDRAAAITGSVAPGANGTFTFTLKSPAGDACVPGTYEEHFGLVQDGITWFSASGQGGPTDGTLVISVEVVTGTGTGTGDGSDDAANMDDATGGCAAGGNGGSGALVLLALVGLLVHSPKCRRMMTSVRPRRSSAR